MLTQLAWITFHLSFSNSIYQDFGALACDMRYTFHHLHDDHAFDKRLAFHFIINVSRQRGQLRRHAMSDSLLSTHERLLLAPFSLFGFCGSFFER